MVFLKGSITKAYIILCVFSQFRFSLMKVDLINDIISYFIFKIDFMLFYFSKIRMGDRYFTRKAGMLDRKKIR